MNEYFPKTPIRIPVVLVDGKWEFFYGGGVPVKEGSIGTLIVEKHQVENKTFVALLGKKAEYKILAERTPLLVALTIRSAGLLEESVRKHLIRPGGIELGVDYYNTNRSDDTRFVKISIGPPLRRQAKLRESEDGGVWLQFAGAECKSITTSSVVVPDEVSVQPLDSLNHAFTKLSEVFEPWRQSHTGSVYTRILYQERNQKWYPLSVLRDATAATDEHALIKEHWAHIKAELFPTPHTK